jgi:hypothetical protein
MKSECGEWVCLEIGNDSPWVNHLNAFEGSSFVHSEKKIKAEKFMALKVRGSTKYTSTPVTPESSAETFSIDVF